MVCPKEDIRPPCNSGLRCFIYASQNQRIEYILEGDSTHVQSKGITLQKEFQILIFGQDGMVGDFLDAFFKSHTTMLNELVLKPSEWTLFWNWWDNDTRVVET